jgi:hypothetical protein
VAQSVIALSFEFFDSAFEFAYAGVARLGRAHVVVLTWMSAPPRCLDGPARETQP